MFQSLRRRLRGAPAQLTLELARPRTGDELLARLRALGLKRIESCRLTRNRNVMVSFCGPELRVHEGYLAAPDDVLVAIVRFVEGPTRLERARARRHLLGYPVEVRAPVRRRETTHPDDREDARLLTEWHARLNRDHFGGALRPLAVRVSRRMRARLGHYATANGAGEPAEIAISRRHLRRHGWDEALQTLLHEMVHQWQDEERMPIDHGAAFRRKAREVGISPRARRTVAA
ncbi:MAG TPA: SprT-like domain-containing protein [Gemmatimonadaceae bacterium]|nr:SprT-like domain-containing protein [Gemmatimonadaceae bacterium]